MAFNRLLKQTCTIKKETTTQGSDGQFTKSFSTVYSNVPCNISRSSRATSNTGGEGLDYIMEGYTIYIEKIYTDIDEGYKIISSDNYTYLIKRANKDSSLHHWELQCERMAKSDG